MKLPNWFKIIWWGALVLLTGIILIKRYEAITTGEAVPVDVFIFLIFMALMLVPIFSEIEFFGVKLKKEIEDLKTTFYVKLGEIKNEIRVAQSQTLHQTIHAFGTPPPDYKLSELDEQIEKIIEEKFQGQKDFDDQSILQKVDVPEDNLLMFKVRYNIESELRRIWETVSDELLFDLRTSNPSIMSMIQVLVKYEILKKNFYHILREVLSICNHAIHGGKVTKRQLSFINKNAAPIIDYLKGIK